MGVSSADEFMAEGASLAAKEERERCAKIAEQFAKANVLLNDGDDAAGVYAVALAIAAEIRRAP